LKDVYKERSTVVQAIIVVFAVLFLLRLFFLQIVSGDNDKMARANAINDIDIFPTRGLVYDRNEKLIVHNEAIYDIMITPRDLKKVDTLKFCEVMNITREDFLVRVQRMKDASGYSPRRPMPFMKQISHKDIVKFVEAQNFFPAFFAQARTIRHYPDACAANILGDVGEVDQKQIDASEGYYRPGDYVGKNGIEKVYEKELGGIRGKREVLIDKFGKEIGAFEGGKNDVSAKAGNNIITSIDIELQKYGEALMKNKKGSIVAIEPATGEILALVSSPTFDPNLLCGAIRGENFRKLNNDSLKPLFPRPTMATYPPGSTFKPVVGLIALNEHVQEVEYTVPCNGVYFFAGLTLHCSHHHPSATNIMYALQQSCNPYFWQTFRNTIENRNYAKTSDIYGKWVKYCNSFGLGIKTGIDLPSESSGNIPSVRYFDKMYGAGQWHSSTIISLGIGQGEITVTPLQMANIFATIANKGYYFSPHLVKQIIDVETGKNVLPAPVKHETLIDRLHYSPVVEGLYQVVEMGTAKSARVDGITICGKTGTAQNPHGDDHSIFAGFAPKDNSKIAISVVVENGGYGATYAVPIASLMIEKYLNDTIAAKRLPVEKRMMEANLMNKYSSKQTENKKKSVPE
jgi:penicillin-binding protein 2